MRSDSEEELRRRQKALAIPDWRTTEAALLPKTANEQRTVDVLIKKAGEGDVAFVESMIKGSKVNPNTRDMKGWPHQLGSQPQRAMAPRSPYVS